MILASSRASQEFSAFVVGLVTGRPLPLQCTFFALRQDGRELAEKAAGYDVVYADGIRTLLWLRRLRRSSPQVRIVVDLDDLMSRRCEQLIARRLPFALGYVERFFPRPLARVLSSRHLARPLLSYERWALRRAEHEVMELADVIVLLNECEAALLDEAGKSLRRRVRAAVRTIPPCVEIPAPVSSKCETAWRAVFVGSDTILQNSLTIEYLVDLWQRWDIRTPLFIYGRQKRQRTSGSNVRYAGYVDEIAEAYAAGSILVCPAFLRGGIKTKALEGFAYGVPVIGNTATFEGMRIAGYPLCIDDEAALAALLQNPSDRLSEFLRARALAFDYLAREHTAERFDARWRAVVASQSPDGAERPRVAELIG